MRVGRRVSQLLEMCCTELHRVRVTAMSAAVTALIRSGEVSSAAVGRAIATKTSEKHGIKRADRLLGNEGLHRARHDIYAGLAAHTLKGIVTPVVLIDWSQHGKDKSILKAVVAFSGRGIPLYAECHGLKFNANPRVQRRFLEKLRTLLPEGCRPIVVTDAGFKTPWCQAVEEMGWDFVTRIRGRTKIRVTPEMPWFSAQNAHEHWNGEVRSFPNAQVNVSDPVSYRVIVRDKRTKRARKKPKKSGRRIREQRAVKRAHESWVLVTSLRKLRAKQIARIYEMRMQIELSLRDDKSLALGWGLEHARCRSNARVEMQLLLIALATVMALLVGIHAEQQGLHFRHQANTVRKRRVISLLTLGMRILTAQTPSIRAAPAMQTFPLLRISIVKTLLIIEPKRGDS